MNFRLFLEHFGSILVVKKIASFEDFFQQGRGMHFGTILGPFWSPFGALWAPFGLRLSSLLHLGGTLVALCALWWCPLGFFSVPSGILVAFSLDFVAFSMDFKRMFLCFHGF